MHFYALSHEEVLQLPLHTFWLLDANVDRIRAQVDKRSLHIASVSAMDVKRLQEIANVLEIETGEVIKTKFDPIRTAVRDESGVAQLKALAGVTAGARIKKKD